LNLQPSKKQKMTTGWPKEPPVLSPEQEAAREEFMKLWHEHLPARARGLERFNQGYVASLPHKPGSKTLEIGAGLGAHLEFENLRDQEYYCLEYREKFCRELCKKIPAEQVFMGDIQKRQSWQDKAFDRIVAIHVLEHLPDLPSAIKETSRLLRDSGTFDIVIPCEGGLAYSLLRKLTAERLFRKTWKMDYLPIIRNEHVSECKEILDLVFTYFRVERQKFYPFSFLKWVWPNLCIGMRLRKKCPA